MKKKILVVCILVFMMAAFAGCGKTEEPAKADDSNNVSTEEPIVEDDANTEEPSTEGGDASLIDMFISENQAMLAATNEAMKDTMEISISSDENDKIIYTYKYLQDLGDEATVKAAMDGAMQGQEEAMDEAVSQLKLLGIENPVVELRFENMDGEEISSYEFK